ncbi:MAG TPA: hypothetical protein VGM42_08445 [Rhodopila sp.]
MRLVIALIAAVTMPVLAACTAPTGDPTNPNVLGATGQTIVIGSSSSMAGSDRVHPNWADASTNAYTGR